MKINPRCDLLIGNRPENDSDTQYYECEDCHRYEICKKHGCVEVCSRKEIKEATPNIIEPSYDLLKQDGYFKMSMIEQQVKEIRKVVEEYKSIPFNDYPHSTSRILEQAADTIESLSAKLAAANMNRSDRYYGVRKELVEQHNKAFELISKMPLEENEVWHGYVAGVMQTLGYLIDSMNQSYRHYGGGWINFNDKLPKNEEKVLLSKNGETLEDLFEFYFPSPDKNIDYEGDGVVGFLEGESARYDGFTILKGNKENIKWQPLP